ncbi:MAG: serine/threonine protein kinase [Planctomycetota bacterium]|nr:serine/threonine protein kinase [Planctomycetota bacterium]
MSKQSATRLEPAPEPDPEKDAAPLGPPAFPPARLGRFLIEREVGRGMDSVVYRAVDPESKEIVALKVLYAASKAQTPEALLEAVRREAEILKGLNHPHIVGVRDSGMADGRPYIAYPFIRGLPLDQGLSSGTLDRHAALKVLVAVAHAVHHAHEQGFIHRDLKPRNVVVSSDGQPYVLDFGLSWFRGDRADEHVQSIVGTPAYMSPEQARGEEEQLTPASDVFALGAMLYEILTGRPPFTGETPWRTRQMIMAKPVTPPRAFDSAIDIHLERIVLHSLEKAPAKRYAAAEQFAEDLERALEGRPPHGPRSTGFLRRLFR